MITSLARIVIVRMAALLMSTGTGSWHESKGSAVPNIYDVSAQNLALRHSDKDTVIDSYLTADHNFIHRALGHTGINFKTRLGGVAALPY